MDNNQIENFQAQNQYVEKTQKDLQNELETNPKYSLEVDPENKYDMTDLQKDFVKKYVDYKNVNIVAELLYIDMDLAKTLFMNYPVQQEIKRINMAMVQRQFASKMVGLDCIGGYLTSLLTGENVAFAELPTLKDKLQIVRMLIDLNTMKINAIANPETIQNTNIEVQIKNLSVETIKELLKTQEKKNDKKIYSTDYTDYNGKNNNSLTMEEEAYLQTLSSEELLNLINETKNSQPVENKKQTKRKGRRKKNEIE